MVINYDKTCIQSIAGAEKFECSKPIVWDPGGLNILGVDILDDSSSNYGKILVKAKEVLKIWTYHELSLMGRVLIANSMVASLFVYTMQVEEDPLPPFQEQFDRIIHQFLWKGKKAKVGMQLLKASKAQGGLNLVHISAKNKALKIKWIFKSNPYTLAQLKQIMPEDLSTLFWDCNMDPDDAAQFVKGKGMNSFWSNAVSQIGFIFAGNTLSKKCTQYVWMIFSGSTQTLRLEVPCYFILK